MLLDRVTMNVMLMSHNTSLAPSKELKIYEEMLFAYLLRKTNTAIKAWGIWNMV